MAVERDVRLAGRRFPLLAGLLILGSLWLFLGVLEDVATNDPLVDFDLTVQQTLQKLRTPLLDGVMVALTALGGVEVVLPLVIAALAWFVWHRLWRTSLYWLLAAGIAELLVKVLKWLLHRPRPASLYQGLEMYSFPSGHATVAVVVYGFLAFLVCRGKVAAVQWRVGLMTGAMLLAIGFSRLYLGVHWFSDVIAGMSLGLAWAGALAIAYSYGAPEDVRPLPLSLSLWLMLVLLLAWSWHAGITLIDR
ncbi:MAG: phosphatase PAP2 family protein [Rhodoferax sp.]|nr:phosphatase PAP2 family protein [Rhodoferax sp.]